MNKKEIENELLKNQVHFLTEKVKSLNNELENEKKDRVQLLRQIVILEDKVDKLYQKLAVSRETRIRLINDAQRITDRNLATLERHSIIATMLNKEKAKVLDLFEENITLKSKSMKDENEFKELKAIYATALRELDETNRGLLEIIKEYEILIRSINHQEYGN
jgi:hypothetical protein